MSDQSIIQLPEPIKKSNRRLITFTQTFQSTLTPHIQKFSLNKTLIRGIKQNDSSKIIENQEQNHFEQLSQIYDQEKEAKGNFVNVRKKYDYSRESTNKITNNIQRLKMEKQLIQNQKLKIDQHLLEQQKLYQNIQNQLKQFQDMCQAAQYMKDIRLQMSQNLKKDILFYKKNCFQANSKIVRNHNRLQTLNCEYESNRKISTNCRTLVLSIQKTILTKQHDRYEKISSFKSIINKKIQNSQKRENNMRTLQSSMSEAITCKMPQQLQQKRLLHVNLLVKRMLKQKMQSQMQANKQIQQTFRTIKQHTSIKTAAQLIQRFLNRQKTYGQLVENISRNQQKLNYLKAQKLELQRNYEEQIYQKEQIEEHQILRRTQGQNKNDLLKLKQKLLNNEQLKNKTSDWIIKFITNFDHKDINQVRTKVNKDKPDVCLKQGLQRINKFLDQLQKQPKTQRKMKIAHNQSTCQSLPQSMATKNTRIKTQTNREQNINSRFQDHDVAYDDISQQEYVNQNRKAIKKSNYLRNRIKTKAF